MVGHLTLAFDISSVVISTAIPGVAWALLFALAWKRPSFAESLGLGRKTFWLLLPGALLASFAVLPIVPVYGDVLAVSASGAGFPLAVGVLLLGRIAPPLRRSAVRLFLPLAGETVLLLGVVLLSDTGHLTSLSRGLGIGIWEAELLAVVVVATAFTAAAVVASLRPSDAGARTVAGIFALTSGVLVLTFATSQAIPGVGIAESFPYFLIAPIFVGLVAVLLAPRLFPGREAFALPTSFLAASWGVVLGADVLWQPPLYGPGSAGLYAIGGAGVLDLVYLSGFLGLLGAWGAYRLVGRKMDPVGEPLPSPPPNPTAQLREAYARGVDGSIDLSLAASASAARAAAFQAQRLLGRPAVDPARPWEGLSVPGWVVSDQANLDSVTRSGTRDPREAFRAFVTARALVRLGETLGRPRFASIGQRLAAFAIDTVLLGAAGSAVFVAIVLWTPGSIDTVVSSVAFSAAFYGFVGASLLYFSVSELWFGATTGKSLVGIEVRDRSLGPVGGIAAFLRNTPLLPVMTLYSLGLSLAITIAMRGFSFSANLAGLGVSAGALAIISLGLVVLAGVGLAGGVGVATIAVTSERQRIGDLWADTWVVRRLRTRATPPPTAASAARSG